MHEHRIGVHDVAQNIELTARIHRQKIRGFVDDLKSILFVFHIARHVRSDFLRNAQLHADDLLLDVVIAHADQLIPGNEQRDNGKRKKDDEKLIQQLPSTDLLDKEVLD